ncbi:Nucleobindin-2 [Holothuria leucospilota]|uniref:Nucleobindin-2 n=1 Tax=Holothuria leucospilota TaxID=206669 RepID=A0A9Q0YK34_HOLLE|nr:Nucleobindin-2 [Holothuria leucospilota]
MKYSELLLLLIVWIDAGSFAPLNPKEGDKSEEEPLPPDSLMDGPQTGLEYEKYLEQVIQVLETDPSMRQKLEGMTMEDLKNGKMAEEIDMLDNNIRSELDELKRLEIQRLRTIARKRMENGGTRTLDTKFVDNLIGHIDPANTNAFGPKDFEKLLHKATSDLEEADRRRKEDFKKYEMEKELRRRAKLQKLDESARQQAIKEWEETRDKRKNHKQMKHPGSKAQLEDVWEKTDHLEKDQFNPKTFFMLHDTNGDLKLDSFELEALFIKEVEEIYKGSNADPKEKFEEIYRMREHVMKEIDTDGDKLVTLEEFLIATKKDDFEKDDGWEDLQQQDLYTEEELEEYRAMYDEVVKEKKEKLKKEQEEYLKRRQQHGAGEPVVMDQGDKLKAP